MIKNSVFFLSLIILFPISAQQGMDQQSEIKDKVIQLFAERHMQSILKEIIDGPSDIHTLLKYVVCWSCDPEEREKVAKLLLEHGANPNTLSNGIREGSPLLCEKLINPKLTALLLRFGAHAHGIGQGYNPLSQAVIDIEISPALADKLIESIRLLLAAGAEPCVPVMLSSDWPDRDDYDAHNGKSPLQLAREYRLTDISQLFADHLLQ